VDEDKLSSTAAIATCPRCKERFRFRDPAAADEDDPQACSASEPGDCPVPDDGALPPGAVVPPRKGDLLDEDLFSHPRDKASSHRAAEPPDEEDEQESRRQAAEAYRRTAEMPPHPEVEELSNPWEDPHAYDGYFAAFYQTAVRVLFAAPRFFAGLVPQKQLTRALIFYLIVGLIQIAAEQSWLVVFAKVLAPTAESDPQLTHLFTLLSREMSLPLFVLARTAFISLELFIASVMYHLMFRIVAPSTANFSLVFQVIAYASAPALLGIVPVLGSLVGFIWGIVCSFVGCRYALRISWRQTFLALGPLYLIIMLLFLQASIALHGM